MAKSTRKLSLKKETLRTLNPEQLAGVAGGLYNSKYGCTYGDSYTCGTTDGFRPPPDLSDQVSGQR